MERRSKLPLLAFWLALGGVFAFAVIRGQLDRVDRDFHMQVPESDTAIVLIEGWSGPSDLEAAGLGLLLAPLHSNPERQAFDSKSLGARLGFERPGSPYRLELSQRDLSDERALELAASIAMAAKSGGLRLEDEQGDLGGLLVDLAIAVGPGASPVLRIFAPERTLGDEDGSSGRLVLWATEPGVGLKLVGPDFVIELTPSTLNRKELPLFVASR